MRAFLAILFLAIAVQCMPQVPEKFATETGFYLQRLNHYDPEDERLWYQPYSFSLGASVDSPILVFVHASTDTNFASIYEGSIFDDIATELGAIRIGLHPRYFGDSLPVTTLTDNNLEFLTIEQTLADFANIISYVRELFGNHNNPVIAVGVGLGGSYALWLRQHYPTLVNHVISSGAPIEARLELQEFYHDVFGSYERLGPGECVSTIDQALRELFELIAVHDHDKIEELFEMGVSFYTHSEKDIALLMTAIGHFVGRAMQVGNALEVESFCSNFEYDRALESFASAFVASEGSGLIFDYDLHVEHLKNVMYSAHPGNERQQLYLSCNQVSWFHTTALLTEPFRDSAPIGFFTGLCADVFGEQFTAEFIQQGNDDTNVMFSGANLHITEALLINGGLNPYRFVGRLAEANLESQEVLIPEYGKGQEFLVADSSDSAELSYVKEMIREQILFWLQ